MADEKLVKSSMPQTDTIPKDVLGDIDKVRPLGKKGGFSHLFRGHKTGLDVDVVIKRIKPDFGRKMDETEEAHILTELRHQYLPRVYDLKKSSDGYIYMVMEYIHGMTLTDYIAKYGELNQKLALKWTREICQVVNYMHTRKPHGIIHSDLKPDNIMVTKDGNICVIDFNASLKVRSPEDELQAIAMIYEIMGDYPQAAATYDRIIDLLRNEWGMTEENGLKEAQKEKTRLLMKV